MFSGNKKISSRQLYRNYAASYISLSALLPPLIMNRECMPGMLLALIFSGFFLWVAASVPRPVSRLMKCLCYTGYWVLGTMLIRMAGRLVQSFLLTGTDLWVILGWFYLFCYYNLYKGLECRFRVSEILFPFFLVLFLILCILMYGEMDPARLGELRLSWDRQQWLTGYELFCWLGAVQSLWHLRGRTEDEVHFRGSVKKIWFTGVVSVVWFSLFSYCIYGNAGHTGLNYPIASAMTLAHFPGNVIGRLDALFIFAWVIGLFLLCSSLFAPLTDGEPDTRSKCLLFAAMAVSFGAACMPECMEWGQKFLYVVLTPLQILILLIQYAGRGKREKRTLAAGCLILSFVLGGCSSQELEQQSLVTAIGVDAGEDGMFCLTFGFGSSEEEGEEPFETESTSIENAKKVYGEYSQKNMDFNHLKNFYFSEEVLGSASFETLLEEIQTNGAYSRGTLVYVTEGAAGEEAAKKEQPEEGMPIHRVLNAWYNQESCKIDVITRDGRYKGYVSWP